jgi:hypothetical protein
VQIGQGGRRLPIRMRCRVFSLATDVKVYFCDPQQLWQRGSNENTNGLLRQYFPKGMDLSSIGVIQELSIWRRSPFRVSQQRGPHRSRHPIPRLRHG